MLNDYNWGRWGVYVVISNNRTFVHWYFNHLALLHQIKIMEKTCIIRCNGKRICRMTQNCKQNSVQLNLKCCFDSRMSFRFQKWHPCCWWCLPSFVGLRLLTPFFRHRNTPKKTKNVFCVNVCNMRPLENSPPLSFSPANIKNSRVWALWRFKRDTKQDASHHNKRNWNETVTWQAECCQTVTYSHQCQVTLKWLQGFSTARKRIITLIKSREMANQGELKVQKREIVQMEEGHL